MPTAAGAWVLTGGAWKRKGQADRTAGVAPFVLGSTKPTRANTGLPSGWTPASTISSLFVPTAGQTYEDIRFDNHAESRVANVTYRRCEFRGPAAAATASNYIVRNNYAGSSNVRYEFCDFIPQTPTQYTHSIEGHDYTLHRCYFRGAVDGPNVYNTTSPGSASNVTIEGCFIELLSYFSPCTYQSDNRTHNDCIQHQGCSGTQIIGNTLAGFLDPAIGDANEPAVTNGDGSHASGYRLSRSPIPNGFYSNAAVQFGNATGNSTNVTMDRNWIDGGVVSLNIPSTAMTGFAITNNRFGQHTNAGVNILAPAALAMTVTGNTVESTGAAANGRTAA